MNWFRNGRFKKSRPSILGPGRLKMDAPCLQCGAMECRDYLADPAFCSMGCEYAYLHAAIDDWPKEEGVSDEDFESYRARLLEDQ